MAGGLSVECSYSEMLTKLAPPKHVQNIDVSTNYEQEAHHWCGTAFTSNRVTLGEKDNIVLNA